MELFIKAKHALLLSEDNSRKSHLENYITRVGAYIVRTAIAQDNFVESLIPSNLNSKVGEIEKLCIEAGYKTKIISHRDEFYLCIEW
jgi:predicted Ser/Thr protein kinase